MKKILLLTAMVLAGASAVYAQATYNPSATGDAKAIIVKPLEVKKTAQMDFGTWAAPTSAGTVVLNAATNAVTGSGVAKVSDASASAGIFTIQGANGSTVNVTWDSSISLTGSGGGTMTIDTITSSGFTTAGPPATLLLDGTVQTVKLGGTLNVGANQTPGTYTGTYTVTAAY